MPAAGLTEAGYVQTILDTIAEFERSDEGRTLRTKLILSVSLPHYPPFKHSSTVPLEPQQENAANLRPL
jgi:hypothetical protein